MTALRRPVPTGVLALALAAGLVAAAPAPAVAGSAPSGWEAVEIGTLGGARTVPAAVNDRGHVVGRSQVADGRWHAFLWRDGAMTDLTPTAQDAHATDVSNGGVVSGWVQQVPGDDHDAFVHRGGRLTVVAENAFALVVNEHGQVGGTVEQPETWSATPFVWTAGRRVDVPPLPYAGAWPTPMLRDLNDRGQVLGVGEYEDDTDLSFLWSGGTFTELRDAVGPMRGVDLNDRGHVAGTTTWPTGRPEAALWRDGAIRRLGVLPGTATSHAVALNDRDVLVGVSGPAPGQRGTAFVWTGGALRAIGTVGAGWSDAADVNERGQVAGALGATTADGTQVAQPYVWQGGRLVRLGSPTSDDVTVVDLSEAGHVATVTGDLGAERGVLWVPRGGSRS